MDHVSILLVKLMNNIYFPESLAKYPPVLKSRDHADSARIPSETADPSISPNIRNMRRIRKLNHMNSRDIYQTKMNRARQQKYGEEKSRRTAIRRNLFATKSELHQGSTDVNGNDKNREIVHETNNWSNSTFVVDPKTSLLRQRIHQASKVARAARHSLRVKSRSSKKSNPRTSRQSGRVNRGRRHRSVNCSTDTDVSDSCDTGSSDSEPAHHSASCPVSFEECLLSNRISYWRNDEDCVSFNVVEFL